MRAADLDGMASGLGVVAVAGLAAVQRAQDANRVEDARRGAAIARATADAYARTAEELAHDIVLAEIENCDLRDEVERVEQELAQERKRAEMLAGMLVAIRNPDLNDDERRQVIADSLAILRAQRIED